MLTAPPASAAVRPSPASSSLVAGAGWVLAAYCALVLLFNLGAAPLVDVDEGAFSEATREMLVRGDYVTTWLNGELRFDKPILTYWLQAAAVSVAGPVEWAFRLPSALAGGLWCWLLFRFARRFAPDAAHMATFMLVSALGPLVMARAATADALLNAFVAGALFAFYRHLVDGRRRDLVAAYAWMGLGLLTKGPIALLVPALAIGVYCVSRGEWLRPLRLLRDPLAWLVMLAIALPWYVLELRAQGQAFIDGFFMKHNVNRFTATMLGHGGSGWYYFALLPLLLFPFVAPLAGAIAGWRTVRGDDVQRFAWCTFLPVLAFFSFSHTQLPHYLLYGLSPMFLLLALHRGRFAAPWWTVGPALAGLALAAALPTLAAQARGRVAKPILQLLLDDFARSMTTLVVPALAASCALAVMALLTTRLPVARRADARLYAAGAIPALFMVAALWPQGIAWFQGPVKEAGLAMRGTDVVEWNANWPSFSVYRGAVTPVRRPQPGETVLTRADRAGELPPHDVVLARREVLVARVRP